MNGAPPLGSFYSSVDTSKIRTIADRRASVQYHIKHMKKSLFGTRILKIKNLKEDSRPSELERLAILIALQNFQSRSGYYLRQEKLFKKKPIGVHTNSPITLSLRMTTWCLKGNPLAKKGLAPVDTAESKSLGLRSLL